ncbi:hypothetical protein GCM10007086_13750 [Photobacterium aphoticum]|nr:hypothetical protein GCM10007086_13750 [Photobacterium aphoticum]
MIVSLIAILKDGEIPAAKESHLNEKAKTKALKFAVILVRFIYCDLNGFTTPTSANGFARLSVTY